MKKIIAPEGWRILGPSELIKKCDKFFSAFTEKYASSNRIGKRADCIAEKYGYTSCYIRKVKKPAKPKKSRPKKSLAQIAYDVFFA